MSDNHDLLVYDPSGVFLDTGGLTRQQLDSLASDLERERNEIVTTDVELLQDSAMIPTTKAPLDAGFYLLPEQTRQQYAQNRTTSDMARILATASRLGQSVDRVVVLGIGGSYMGARALMDACCQPYFNQLGPGGRGGRPEMYFQGNNVDNDATQGLLDLLNGPNSKPWAIVVISKSGSTLETAVAFRLFLRALQKSVNNNAALVSERVVPVTEHGSRLFQVAEAIGCTDIFVYPNRVGGRFSVLSAVGLLPAALLGLDVVKMLEGAAVMNEHFRTAPVAENIVLKYAGVCHLMDTKCDATIRVLSVWSNALETVGLWYDQLLAESLGKDNKGATPITAVNTRDLHSRAQQHQEGRADKLHTNLIVHQGRTDPIPVGRSELNQDCLNKIQDKRLPDIMQAAITGTCQAYHAGNRPTADLHLPQINEYYLGQFFQMMMLATVVEGRLLGVNPYGQPGVELYKQNMRHILGLEAESKDDSKHLA